MQRFVAFLETVKAADAGGCPPMHALPCLPVTATLDACDVALHDAPLEAVLCNASWQQEGMFAVPKAIDD
jgi:Asp-tRNA(Asn)/Glu-tRNA(Gln) amidotransferase C subunit